MIKFFRKIRYNLMSENKIGKYFKYAIGEIILVVIGILLAVYINEQITENRNNIVRCKYLEELKFTLEYDIEDIEENISGLEKWNPKLEKLISAIQNRQLADLDSLKDKIGTAAQFIFFVQRSKSKIEELKYSNIDLLTDRSLKNKILLYQDNEISSLREIERRYNLIDEALRQYFQKNIGNDIGIYIGNDVYLKQLESDRQFLSVVSQKHFMNEWLKNMYKIILNEQFEIKKLLESELEKSCKKNN